MGLKNRYFKTVTHASLFNLQYFAEDGDDGNEDKSTAEDKTLTQDQVNDIIAKRLAKEKAKWEKDYNAKLEAEKAEAARLANLDATQRAEEEAKKRIAALEEREAKLKQAEDKLECESVLKERGLSTSFANFLLGADAEVTLANINSFETAFKDAVKAEVETRIKGKTPPAGGGEIKDGAVSKEEFKKLPLYEQNKLYLSNPELYKTYYGA